MATLQNTTINSTGFLTIPVGNTTQRPGSPTNGMLRFNTDTGQIEVYNSGATAWGSITGPTISQIQITDSSYNVLDDTAVNTAGGYIKITGTGFGAGAVVIIGSVNATSTTVVNSTTLNVQVPAQVAGTYTVYVVNTNGGTAIGVNGLTYSALPNWVTGSTLPNGQTGTAISIQLNATDATSYALAPANTLPSGLTLTSGGLLSGTVTVGAETTYSFTIIATDAQLQDSPRAFTITISVGDPYFYLTTLLLAGNGTNNGTNNAFTDSSTNALALTRYGNTTQGTYTPFSQTGWSNYFDGTGDYLSIGSNSAFNMNTYASLEVFVYFNGFSNETLLFGKESFWLSYGAASLGGTNGKFSFNLYNGSSWAAATASSITPVVGQWYHIVGIRDSGTIRIYVNGTQQATAAVSGVGNTLNTFLIGGGQGGAYQYLNGYISNGRYITGASSAVLPYTGASFTVPTSALTATSGTVLLTCQSNRFIDNSTNNFAITVNGDTSVQSFSPFAPGSSYSAGTVGGSAYLDGTGDYLMVADSTATDLGISQQPFTLEWWTYLTTTTGGQYIITKGGGFGGWNGTNGWQYLLSIELSSSVWSLGYYNGSSYTYWQPSYSSVGISGRWNHMVLSYNGTNLSAFMNGTRIGTTTVTNFTKPSSSNKCSIGSAYGVSGEAYYYNGYVSGFRIVKGTAVYDPTLSTLTVPTAPPTAIANTSLLCNFTNGQILDSTSKNVLETLGDAKISTAQSKWGGSSIAFDGTGDYLSVPTKYNFTLGSGDFTLEFWFRLNTVNSGGVDSNTPCLLTIGWSWGVYGPLLLLQANSGITVYASTDGSTWAINSVVTTSALSANTWYHYAMVRSGTSVKYYLNGVASATTSTLSGSLMSTSTNTTIGASSTGAGNLNGYMQDIRVTKYARYTTNFTPPSSAFPTQ